jgi:type IV secretory pathway VirB10-like protein
LLFLVDPEHKQLPARSLPQLECSNMATSAKAFFAGIGATFVILAIGFGGGVMLAKSALKEPSGFQTRAAGEALTPVRVILPSSAQAAQPPQELHQPATSPPEPDMTPASQPAQQVQASVEKQVQKADTRKSEAQARERKRRYAERKAKRDAEARVRRDQQRPRELEDTPMMAFGGDDSPRFGGGFFGN